MRELHTMAQVALIHWWDAPAQTMMLDIYTRRRYIDDKNGKRLQGTRPYDHNKGTAVHHAYAVELIEDSDADVILLCGKVVHGFFETNLGELQETMPIGGRQLS